MTLHDELTWRGLIHDETSGAKDALARPLTAYIGFDPAARSLHVGSLVPLTMLSRLQRAGHRVIALVGGGTGMIGDPSGKSAERVLQTDEQVAANVEGIRAQIARFVSFEGSNPALLVDNAEWLSKLSLVRFLRDVGKHFTVNHMLAKESVKRRVESETGISYTEFTYMLLQAADFVELFDRHGATLQLGGSDQWGNITAGCDLIRSSRGGKAHGITWPLITSASGVKFGKTEAGALWLDPSMTSPYRFFQFWMSVEDHDVVRFLKTFTALPREEIDEIAARHAAAPHERAAPTRLAEEMTRTVHGEEGLERARRATHVFFGGDFMEMPAAEIREIFSDVPTGVAVPGDFDGEGMNVIDALVRTGLAPSRKEGKRQIEGGGIYVNQRRIESADARLALADALFGELFVLRKGKRSYCVLRVEREASVPRGAEA
jgi:tyrosyl-tRNA synthetase